MRIPDPVHSTCYGRQLLTSAGLEPAVPVSVGRCLIHVAYTAILGKATSSPVYAADQSAALRSGVHLGWIRVRPETDFILFPLPSDASAAVAPSPRRTSGRRATRGAASTRCPAPRIAAARPVALLRTPRTLLHRPRSRRRHHGPGAYESWAPGPRSHDPAHRVDQRAVAPNAAVEATSG